MGDTKNGASQIDEYISQFPTEVRAILDRMRKVIKDAAPDAEEKISYQMPAFMQNGPLVYFAAFKSHIGFFPTATGVEAFKKEFSAYKGGKGSVQFPIDKPIPYDLVSRVVKFKVEDNKKAAEGKLKKK